MTRERAKLEPRGYNLEAAAERLGITVADFEYFRFMGRIPAPLVISADCKIWDGHELQIGSFFSHPRDKVSGVYVIGFSDYIKIGFSTDVAVRIAGLQDSVPEILKIHKIMPGLDRRHEGKFHKQFSVYRTRGEWFRHEAELKSWIEAGCP